MLDRVIFEFPYDLYGVIDIDSSENIIEVEFEYEINEVFPDLSIGFSLDEIKQEYQITLDNFRLSRVFLNGLIYNEYFNVELIDDLKKIAVKLAEERL